MTLNLAFNFQFADLYDRTSLSRLDGIFLDELRAADAPERIHRRGRGEARRSRSFSLFRHCEPVSGEAIQSGDSGSPRPLRGLAMTEKTQHSLRSSASSAVALSFSVMAGPSLRRARRRFAAAQRKFPAIHVAPHSQRRFFRPDVDARNKCGQDECSFVERT